MVRTGPWPLRRTDSGNFAPRLPSQASIRHRAQGSRNSPRGRSPFRWHRFNTVFQYIPCVSTKPSPAENHGEAEHVVSRSRSEASGSLPDHRYPKRHDSSHGMETQIRCRRPGLRTRLPDSPQENLNLISENYGAFFDEVNRSSRIVLFCKLWNRREQEFPHIENTLRKMSRQGHPASSWTGPVDH